MPDARKTLAELNATWSSCQACELGVRRYATGGAFVAGEGLRRGIMFIGEGPGATEEELGRPFMGASGTLLRQIIAKIGIDNYYITNIVPCRSCSPATDASGLPMFRRQQGKPSVPIYRDEPPLPVSMKACSPRLYEEIYLVDPIVIVTLGVTSAQLLLGHPVTITKDRGRTEHAYIPGATHRPVHTEKRGVWARKHNSELVMPVEQNEVMYELLPTLHPAFVLRKLADKGSNSPFQQLVADLKYAMQIYERYMLEAHGVLPTRTLEPDEKMYQADENDALE